MSYKWKPTKQQKDQFRQNMQDPNYVNDYYKKKQAKKDKNRSMSVFDYPTAGGKYVPTELQYARAISLLKLPVLTDSEKEAANQVITGYVCQDKINHDYIHIINEAYRLGLIE